jgi:hypothetical protein
MPTFRVEWTEEYWFRTYIVATDKQEAIDKWASGNYDDYGKLDHYGMEIQDGVDIEMIEEQE